MERWIKDIQTKVVNVYYEGEFVRMNKQIANRDTLYIKYLRETKRAKVGFELIIELSDESLKLMELLFSMDIAEATKHVATLAYGSVVVHGK